MSSNAPPVFLSGITINCRNWRWPRVARAYRFRARPPRQNGRRKGSRPAGVPTRGGRSKTGMKQSGWLKGLRMEAKDFSALGLLLAALLMPMEASAGDINDVTFLTRIQVYETTVDTTLVTQEGKRVRIPKGTRLNIAGFTKDEAFVISHSDRPNGFVWKDTIALKGPARSLPGPIREE